MVYSIFPNVPRQKLGSFSLYGEVSGRILKCFMRGSRDFGRFVAHFWWSYEKKLWLSLRYDNDTARILQSFVEINVARRCIVFQPQPTFYALSTSREKRPGPHEIHLRFFSERKWMSMGPQRLSRNVKGA